MKGVVLVILLACIFSCNKNKECRVDCISSTGVEKILTTTTSHTEEEFCENKAEDFMNALDCAVMTGCGCD